MLKYIGNDSTVITAHLPPGESSWVFRVPIARGEVTVIRARCLPTVLNQTECHDLLNDLPSFHRRVAANIWAQLVEGWSRAAALFRQQQLINALIFCHPDAGKSMMLKAEDEVLILLMRSKTTDLRYLGFLSDYFGFSFDAARKDFEDLPAFDTPTVKQVMDGLRDRDPGLALPNSAREATQLAQAYETQLDDGIDLFRFDMRLFNTMRSLRRMMVDARVQVLVQHQSGPHEGLTEFFVYHTSDVVAKRPPVYAAFPEGLKLQERIRRLESNPSQMPDNLADEPQLPRLLHGLVPGVGFPDQFKSYSSLIESGHPKVAAVVDIGGQGLARHQALLIRDAVQAGLDCTEKAAMRSLSHRALISTKSNAIGLQQLFDIYAAGLLSARPVEPAMDDQWSASLRRARDCVANLGAISRRPRATEKMDALLNAFTDATATHNRFDKSLVDSRIKSLEEQVHFERLGVA